MVASIVAARIASSAVAPLVKKLFVQDGPGAGIVDRPVRISGLVSFKGEKRTLTEKDLRALAAELVSRETQTAGGREAPTDEIQIELVDALTTALHSLGDLDMDDVQAVRLGAEGLARQLAQPKAMSGDAEYRYRPLLHTACLHILNFFTQRSTFVPRTLAEQARAIDKLIAATDLLIERIPSQTAADARFEQRYAEHIARKYGDLTIYGLDLNHASEWQLDSAYISLQATSDAGTPMPAERALSGHDRVLLRGGAGSGKTTLVQWLAVTAARQDYDEHLTQLIGRVPFVLPLRRVIQDGIPPTPDQFLHSVRSSTAGAQPDGWADRVLRAGRALLLIDGIDEIPDFERERTRRWINELMADFPNNLWLVTARPSAVRDDWLAGASFTELSLSPMSRTNISLFVRRWHEAAEAAPDLGEALLSSIRANGDLDSLAVNPLMCGLLCALHRDRNGFLPNGRKDLYEAALSTLLERRDVERGVRIDEGLRLSKETQVQLLQKLAHWLIRNDRAEMEHSDALTQIRRALEYMAHVKASPERVLGHLLNRSGLLREPATDRVDFVHRTFQDYLGAKAAIEEGDFPLLLDNANKDQWEDVIRMAVALGRPAERARILEGLIAEVDENDERKRVGGVIIGYDQYWNLRNIILAATCLEHATEISPDVRQRVLEFVSEFIPPKTGQWTRHLAELGGPMVLKLLPGPEGLTDDEAANVVTTAALIGTDAALLVLTRYRTHPALEVRRQLSWAWHRFEAAQYAEEILAHVDETDLYFSAHNVEQLDILRTMGGRPRIQVVGSYRPRDLVEHINAERVTHLWLHDGYHIVNGEEWLRSFPHLRVLALPGPYPTTEPTIPPDVTILYAGDGYPVD